jgi:Uma2 family endonuclease
MHLGGTTTMAVTAVTTIEDLSRIEDDGLRYELVEGKLICMSPAGGRHGRIIFELVLLLGNYVRDRNLGQLYIGETGFILARDPDTVLVPDVAFVQAANVPNEENEIGFLDLIPDLVIEVVSPSDRAKDTTAKVSTYLAVGVRLIWQVDPAKRAVIVYTPEEPQTVLVETDQLDGGDVVTGFTMQVAEIFGRSTQTAS